MTAITKLSSVAETTSSKEQSVRILQNEAARRLLREWLSDTSGYDEAAWPQAKKVIEENRLSPRSRFDD